MAPKLAVCVTCEGGVALADRLEETIPVTRVECMNVCTRPACLSVREEGKAAYLFGDVTTALAPNVLTFLDLYASSEGGIMTDARPIGDLRFQLIGRLPA
ncbi:DUF1636 family protein [Aliiroseovarius sp. KMU-50]|uniref:DUF1636 family protein n=1 Tax=Aliiroseovarius salicola TaxID=3009082 RepID=A0ABT4W4I7_9RHOB|nr:DUF1636 family protein [Aliiroseovarius sp. KMU-50]MDA5095427.1 DUF1636 family protein [Aliiroseovarius sp. KMU-50]